VVETGGLENHCTEIDVGCNPLKTEESTRAASQIGDCSKTVVAGEVAEGLMAPVLKTGIP
jgi:hypothetical protein